MRPEYIEIHSVRITEAKGYVELGYNIEEDAPWYAKLLWKFLIKNKHASMKLEETSDITRHTIPIKKLDEYLYECYVEARKHSSRALTTVYMGPEEFKKVCIDYDMASSFMLSFKYNSTLSLLDTEVVVVPYMKGVLFV